MPSLHIAKGLPFCLPESCCLPCLPAFIVADFQPNRAKSGKNEFLFGVLWCFFGIFGDNKGQNTNIFLKVGAGGAGCAGSLACLLVQAFEAQDLPEVGSGPLVVCPVPFVRFIALLLLGCP